MDTVSPKVVLCSPQIQLLYLFGEVLLVRQFLLAQVWNDVTLTLDTERIKELLE